jgi:hypothetical protein
MSKRVVGRRGQLSSRWMASLGALGYLAISAVVGVSLLLTPADPDATEAVRQIPFSAAGGMGAGVDPNSPASPTSTGANPPANNHPPAGYQYVTGPAGLRTVIPTGWYPIRVTGGMQATDPADASRYVRYGASPAAKQNIEVAHVKQEREFAKKSTGYRKINMSLGRYGGHEAIEWEYEHQVGKRTVHVRALYWRVDGTEYFLLATSPAAGWSRMRPVYETMIAKASP